MPDSVQQLLEAIARSLAEDVSPHVIDRFAQMQCKAAAELLGNLAAELDWAPQPLQRRNQELGELLAALDQVGWRRRTSSASDLPADQFQRALLDELGEALRWLSTQPISARETIDGLLRADLERQVAALRRGMFR